MVTDSEAACTVGSVRRPLKSLRALVVVSGVVVVIVACGGIDDNEIHCEEAVSRLQDCCGPAFDPRKFNCVEDSNGCNTSSPDFYDSASKCIRDSSCKQLQDKGKCAAFIQIANTPYPQENRQQIETEACR